MVLFVNAILGGYLMWKEFQKPALPPFTASILPSTAKWVVMEGELVDARFTGSVYVGEVFYWNQTYNSPRVYSAMIFPKDVEEMHGYEPVDGVVMTKKDMEEILRDMRTRNNEKDRGEEACKVVIEQFFGHEWEGAVKDKTRGILVFKMKDNL
jgi:hypothetical protein